MHPLTISVNDYLVVSFTNNSKSAPLLITAVSVSTVNNMKSYAVTAGGAVYTCTAANTTLLEKNNNANDGTTVETWVIGA